MKQNNFEKILLDNNIVDHRNLYIIVAKKRLIIPSFSIMVMGLYKEKFVFYKISTSYRLIKFVEELNINQIDSIDIRNKRIDTIMNLNMGRTKKIYFILEHNKDIYTIKKNIKK